MSDLISDFRNYLVEREKSPKTVELYVRYVETLQRDVGDPVTLSTDALRGWLKSKRGKASTVSNRITSLKRFYGFLVTSGALQHDPALALKHPKRRSTPRTPVENLDEVLLLLDDVDRKANQWMVERRRVGESRDLAVFLAETGLRVSEAIACDWPVPCPSEVKVVRKGRPTTTFIVSQSAREAWDRLGGKWPCGARATQRRFEKAGIHPDQLRHRQRANGQGSHPRLGIRQASRALPRRTEAAIDEIAEQYSDDDLGLIVGFLTKVLDARQKAAT